MGTLLLVGVTFILALVTFRQVQLSRRTFNMSIRPLLVEPVAQDVEPPDKVLFGAPGRNEVQVSYGRLYLDDDHGQVRSLQFSVPFRNAGPGTAVITGTRTVPAGAGEINASRMYVSVGECVRVDGSISTSMSKTLVESVKSWSFDVEVDYCDVEGNQHMISAAQIRKYVTMDWHIERITIRYAGKVKPFLISARSHTSTSVRQPLRRQATPTEQPPH